MKKTLFVLWLLVGMAGAAFAQRDLNIVYIGNSITYGALHQNPEVTAPPVVCSHWLSQQEGIGQCRFVNMGKSGKTTFNFVPAKTGIQNYWQELIGKTNQLVSEHPKAELVFSIMLGTNDTAERPANSRTTPYMYHHNMGLIIDSLLSRYPSARIVLHKPIYFSVPFTTRNGSYQSTEAPELLSRYLRELEALAHGNPQVCVGDTLAFEYFRQSYHKTLIHEHGYQECDFWLHPNESGSATLAEYWGRTILLLLKRD